MNIEYTYERQLIGRIITDKEAYYQNADIIGSHLFGYYAELYESFENRVKSGKHPTATVLQSEHKDLKVIDIVKEVDYTYDIYEMVQHLDEVQRCKRINNACGEAVSLYTSEEKLTKISTSISGLSKDTSKSFQDVYEIGKQILLGMETPTVVEIDTGFRYLNTLMGGLQRSDLVIVSAETSQGKTSLALNIADNVSSNGTGVAVISLEMSEVQLTNRIISSASGLDKWQLRREENLELAQGAVSQYKGKPFFIVDVKNTSLQHIVGLIRSTVIKSKVVLVVVDYLQLVSDKNQRSREQEVGQVARALKNLAKELDICIVALSQLSRAPKGGSHYPTMSRLRDSGQIEEAADVVIFIYRPEYYGITETDDGRSTGGLAEIIIAKGRNYGTGKFECKFEGRITKFSDFGDRDGIRNFEEPETVEGKVPF